MNKKLLARKTFSLPALLLVLIFSACAQGPNSRAGGWGHMTGSGYGGGFMWLIIVVLVGVAIYFMLQFSKSKTADGYVLGAPLDFLKKRYAKGEIDKEEFERKKKDLEE
jgi:putative membrane protein